VPMPVNMIHVGLQSRSEKERWAAAEAATEYAYTEPEKIWPLVIQFGSSDELDLRQAIASCVLEHVLEHHFETFFPHLEAAIRGGNAHLRHTLKLSWKLGRSEITANSERWDALLSETSSLGTPR
jgi:hypothetical protein